MLRLIALTGLFVAVSLALAACGGSDESFDSADGPTTAATIAPDGSGAETSGPTVAPTTASTVEPTTAPTVEPTPEATDAAEVDACELMADEFVEEVIGEAIEFTDRGLGEGVGGRTDVCYYHFGGSSEVVVRAVVGAESYYEDSFGDVVEDIADEAKWHEGLRTLVVLRDGNVAEVGVSPSLTPGGTATDAFEAAKLMAEAMLDSF